MGLGCEDELYVSRKVFGGGRTIGARRWWKLGAGYGTVGSLRERRGARKDRHGLGGAVEKAGKDGGGGVCGGRDAGGESGRDLTGRRGEGEKGLGRGGDGGCVCMLGVEGVTGIYLCRKQRRTASRVAYFRSFVRSFVRSFFLFFLQGLLDRSRQVEVQPAGVGILLFRGRRSPGSDPGPSDQRCEWCASRAKQSVYVDIGSM